jgi:hypothetical protein
MFDVGTYVIVPSCRLHARINFMKSTRAVVTAVAHNKYTDRTKYHVAPKQRSIEHLATGSSYVLGDLLVVAV